MGRLHSKGKGISASAIPYSRAVPSWFKSNPDQVVDQICKLAKKGATPSQIGVMLRDSHGVAQVKVVTGSCFPRGLMIGEGRTNVLGCGREQDFEDIEEQWYVIYRGRRYGVKQWKRGHGVFGLRLCISLLFSRKYETDRVIFPHK